MLYVCTTVELMISLPQIFVLFTQEGESIDQLLSNQSQNTLSKYAIK